jgi:hypothetical protein
MTNKSKTLKNLSLALVATGLLLIGGSSAETNAQNSDPFAKPSWAKPKAPSTATSSSGSSKSTSDKPKPTGPVVVAPPSIEARINYYKRLREEAAAGGMELPKVTSVLTLDEMSVTGIFRTPRGYAAMVEAKPIKLSYTIYPGEKFFDGQLVAIEENRLIFRKVTKMSNGKFISSVENKALRQYTMQETVQGTAPVAPAATPAETAATETAATEPAVKPAEKPAEPTVIISPVDEMNRQPQSDPKDSAKQKTGKKSKKIARNKKQ